MPAPQPPHAGHANGFTFLRLALALAVVVGHAFLLGGFGSDPVFGWSRGLLSLHEMALQGFFILSGCLLTRSLATHPSLRRFALRRCFRILPGYWFALIVIAFGVAPGLFACLYPGRFSYLESLVVDRSNALVYLSKNAILWSDHHRITPLFFGNPVPAAINGSIWTIFFEVLCYIALGLASAFGLLRRRSLMLWVFALLYLPCAVQAVIPSALHRPSSELERILVVLFDPAGPNLALPFAAGVAAQLLAAGRRVWSARWFCIVVFAFALSLPLGAVRVFCPLVLPYLLLSLGERLPFQKLERVGDFSYGIYIYAFVIQQCLTQFGVNRHGFPVYLAASIGLSMAAGAMSWFLIERPCIRLGQRLLSREKPKGVISSVSTLQPVAATIEV